MFQQQQKAHIVVCVRVRQFDVFNSDEADCHVTSANWYVPMREMHMLH